MNISLTYEAFSLSIVKAGEIQRKGLSNAELYRDLVSSGKLERLLILRAKSGQRSVLENVTEYKYATQFNPGHAGDEVNPPKSANGGKGDPAAPVKTAGAYGPGIPVTPVAFETKPLGDSIEAEAILSEGSTIVDLNISITHTALAGRDKWGQGLGEVEQPQFESQKINTNASLSIGCPFLAGTLNPVFGNGVTKNAEQNVWFCFITATCVRGSGEAGKKSAH